MKIQFRLIVAFFVFAFLTNCSIRDASDIKKEQGGVISNLKADSSFSSKENLSLDLTIGKTYYQNSFIQNSIIQKINDKDENIGMEATSKTSFKILDLKNDIYNIEVKYESMKLKISHFPDIKEFSSEKNDKADVISNLLKGIKNKPFTIQMTKKGKIVDVYNIEFFMDNVIAKFPLNETQKKIAKTQLMEAFGEKAFKANLEISSSIFPDSLVSKGDKWKVITQPEAGIALYIETIFELKESNDTICKLSGNSKIKTLVNDKYTEYNGKFVLYSMQGTKTSDITIDKKSGWIKSASINQKISGIADLKDKQTDPGGVEYLSLDMASEISISE